MPELSSGPRPSCGRRRPRGRYRQPRRPRGRPVPAALEAGVQALLAVPELDAVVVVLVPTSLADPGGLFDAVSRAGAKCAGRSCSSRPTRPSRSAPRRHRLPNRGGSGGGARAHHEYAAWRRVPAEEPPAALGVRAAFARPGPSERLAARGGGRVAAGSATASCSVVRHRPRRRPGPQRRRGRPGRGGDRLPGRGEGGRPDVSAQDRPRAGAGRAADVGGGAGGRRRLRAELGSDSSMFGYSRCSPGSRWPAEWSATRCSDRWSGSPRAASRPRS